MLGQRTRNQQLNETLAIAPLLGYTVSDLVDQIGEQRMATFWKTLKFVPQDLLFHSAGQLSLHPFRWARSTLMTQRDGYFSAEGDVLDCVTEDGLLASYLCFSFPGRMRANLEDNKRRSEVINKETGQAYQILPSNEAADKAIHFDVIVLKDFVEANAKFGRVAMLTKTGESAEGIPIFQLQGVLGVMNLKVAWDTYWETFVCDRLTEMKLIVA